MYFNVGVPGPAGYKAMAATGVKLTPKFVSLLTKTGSPGGSTIVLNVQGVGRNDTVKMVQYEKAGSWKYLCKSKPTVIGYGRIECDTFAFAIPAATKLRILGTDDTTYECANSDPTQCEYS